MAAAGGLLRDICEEATCSICLDYFTDPVIITECGHNFCQACLTQCWGKSDTEACCPQCREIVQERNFRPNRPLANVAEIAKKLRMIPSLQGEKGPEGKGRICEKHQEPLKLFCKDHGRLICVVCDRSKEHENHKEETQAEKQRTMAAFRKFHQFLEEQEKLLLTQMEKAEEEISRRRDEHLSRLSEELSSLEKMIQEVEEKCLQPAGELLQDIGSTMQRCQTKEPFKNPVLFSPALKWKIWDFVDSNPFLEGVFKKFKDTLESGLPLQKAK
ncbi:zinc finger protein RFP-like [Hemicordylus capensis]|uniref:zinc finger protein RFP-like n=1 Tax=Hemicordylus capensis TaxID=884348 RepID=UPI002303930D|nr:zinc finger protein RFP-like [Hemicordylus capensis]